MLPLILEASFSRSPLIPLLLLTLARPFLVTRRCVVVISTTIYVNLRRVSFISARRAVLGLDKEEKEKLDIPELETEKEIKEIDADQEARGEDVGQKTAGSPEESAQERIFSGEIPKEVYKQAIKGA